MAINWGIALGKAIESGFNTYERLGEEELRAMQRSQLKKKIEGEEAYAKAVAEETKIRDFSKATQGQAVGNVVDTALQFSTPEQQAEFKAGIQKLVASGNYEQAKNALRAYAGTEYVKPAQAGEAGAAIPDLANINVYKGAGDQALATTEKGEMRSQSDIYRGVVQRLAESGNPEQIKTALEMKVLSRQSEKDDKQDAAYKEISDMVKKITTMSTTGNVDGFLKEAKDKGLDIKTTQLKNGAIRFEYTDPTTKQKYTASSLQEAAQIATKAFMMDYASTKGGDIFGSPEKMFDYMFKRDQMGLEERKTAAAEKLANAKASALGGLGGGGGGSKNIRTATIETIDSNGQKVKMPISVVGTMVNGVPKIEAYTLDGKKLTDPKILNQITTGESAGGPFALRRAGVYDAYAKRDITYDQLKAELSQIAQDEVTEQKMSLNLPERGQNLRVDSGSGVVVKSGVRTGKERLAAEKEVIKDEQKKQLNKSKGLGYTQKLQD